MHVEEEGKRNRAENKESQKERTEENHASVFQTLYSKRKAQHTVSVKELDTRTHCCSKQSLYMGSWVLSGLYNQSSRWILMELRELKVR